MRKEKFDRLHRSINWSQKQLEYPRSERLKVVKQFVGSHFSEAGAERRVPVPFMALAVMIYVRQLAPNAPRALFTTYVDHERPAAATMELALNQIAKEIELGRTLRRMVAEALFSPWGVVKCGLATAGTAMGHAYGESFVDLVTFDDYFLDMSAKSEDQIDYEGNDYWLDYEALMDSGEMDRGTRKTIKPDDRSYIGVNGEDRVDSIVTNSTAETYRDKVWCRDVWLRDEQLLLTYGITSQKIIKEVKLDGPPHGPYHRLNFIEVVGEILGLPPTSLWRDLHELANALFRKLGRQADGQKDVMGFEDDESANAFKNAMDGHGIKWHGRKPERLAAGGVNRETLAFQMQCRELFSYFAGNLDTLGGLAPVTETVGGSELISNAASAQIRDMANSVFDAAKGIYSDLAYYEWNDPIKRRRLEKQIPGTDIKIATELGPEHKRGSLDIFKLDIDVYSMQDDSAATKLQKLGLVLKEYVLPLAELIERTGGVIQTDKIFELVAKYSNFPELNDLVVFVDNLMQPQQGGGGKSGMPAHTTREYIRRGAPGQSRQGASAATQQMLLGGNVQDAEVPG